MTASELLSVEESYRADAAAAESGIPGIALMEAAGTQIARAIRARWTPRAVTVLCGPGNNGGDGFVVARLLAASGWPVRLALLGGQEKLKGDAATNAGRWRGPVQPLSTDVLAGGPLVVDALFGAGLARPLEDTVRDVVEAIGVRDLDCVGVDVPSGVLGDSGEILGAAPTCRLTVTFFRPKPGHFLLPGRKHVGELVVGDIGIPERVLDAIRPATRLNRPDWWGGGFPWPRVDGHKYSRGHAVIVGGAEMTGAARLAAAGARRAGAGLLTIAAPSEAAAIYRGGAPGVIVKETDDAHAFTELLADHRRNAVLVGPGAGVSDTTRERVLAALGAGKGCVFDADALSAFQENPGAFFAATDGPCVLTPHEGEFARLFPDLRGDRLSRARAAAARSGAVVLLKGPDTVIAAPDGRASIDDNAPPDLASGGTGDVLAGLVLGLLAQGMPPFEAAAAAAWLHGRAAQKIGPGLIAEDLPGAVPDVLKELKVSSAGWS